MFLYKNLFFFNIFCYFNPNHAYWNQRRLFSGNLPGMFFIRQMYANTVKVKGENTDISIKIIVIQFRGWICHFYWVYRNCGPNYNTSTKQN